MRLDASFGPNWRIASKYQYILQPELVRLFQQPKTVKKSRTALVYAKGGACLGQAEPFLQNTGRLLADDNQETG